MPEINAVKLAELFLSLRSDAKVIFMSGYPATGQLAPVDLPPDAYFMAKPISYEALALMLRELIDGDMERVARLSRAVFDKPFSLIDGIVSAYSPGKNSALTTASVIALIIGHVQMARILPYLSSGHADHADPKIIAAHVLSTLQRALKDQSDAL